MIPFTTKVELLIAVVLIGIPVHLSVWLFWKNFLSNKDAR